MFHCMRVKLFASLAIVAATLTFAILVGCGAPSQPTATDAKNKERDMEKTSTADKSAAPAKVNRTDAVATAKAVLTAYKEKKLSDLSELSYGENREMIAAIGKEGPAHPRYNSLFLGWRWETISNWKGEIDEVRYERKSTALVKFAKTGPAEVAVVTLEWIDDKWCFEDIHSPPKDEFESLPTSRD